jgi:hypothetical protein
MNYDFSNVNPDLSSSNDVIRQLEPTVIPRVSAIAKIALCERESIRFTLDRFNFTAGLISMRYLDNFYRRSPYADVILQYRN